MHFKKIIGLFVLLVAMMSTSYAADFYHSYGTFFLAEKPDSMIIDVYECQNSACTSAVPANIEIFEGDSIQCWIDHSTDAVAYENCMQTYKISGNTLNLNSCSTISNGCSGDPHLFIKYNPDSVHGYISYYYTEEDSYVPYRFRTRDFICDFDICVDPIPDDILFGRIVDAHAEIQQLNIVNSQNPLAPITVNVPVEIDQTTCSAFTFTNPNVFHPAAPAGYDDYDAETLIELTVSNNATGQIYHTAQTQVAIEADTCTGQASFSFTPGNALVGEGIKFRVDTDVVDRQAKSSIPDYAEVVEIIFPEDINNSCYVDSHDFTLSNIASFNLNSQNAQIQEGEDLFAGFRAAAYYSDDMTPVDFRATILVDGVLAYTDVLNSGATPDEYFVDLSSFIQSYGAGTYNVTLNTLPLGQACDPAVPDHQNQKLYIIPSNANEYTVNFYVREVNTNPIANAQVVFDGTQFTNANGFTSFVDVDEGTYTYTVSAPGFIPVSNSIFIGSDTDIYITLQDNSTGNNFPPQIDIPAEFTINYTEVLEFDLEPYVFDPNHLFGDLTVDAQVISGTGNVIFDGQNIRVSTTTPNNVTIRVTVTDPGSLSDSDVSLIHFVNGSGGCCTNNSNPFVANFFANPDNGPVSLTTQFTVDTFDPDGDVLTCTLNFGDGNSITDLCDSLNGIYHTYTTPQVFVPTLFVTDNQGGSANANDVVTVYEIQGGNPVIDYLTLTTGTGDYTLPNTLYIDFKASHTGGLDMNCTLDVNGASYTVSDNGQLTINNYNTPGNANIVYTCVDKFAQSDSESLTKFFDDGSNQLNPGDIGLVIDSMIEPGEFEFGLIINESLERRQVTFKPRVICNGAIAQLPDGYQRLHLSSATSKRSFENNFIHVFKLDTLDFTSIIPKGEMCRFEVEVFDKYGSIVTISKAVKFAYNDGNDNYYSVRGKATDIADWMETVLEGKIHRGYNDVRLDVVGNEYGGETRDLQITITSRVLGIQMKESSEVGPGERVQVNLPIFVDEDLSPGMYPIRFSVYDGENFQTRYSYIRID
jgi:hypothetical protein